MLIAAVYDGEKVKIPAKLYRHPVKVWTHLCEPGTHNTTCRFLLDVDIQINIDIIIPFVVTTQNMSVVVSTGWPVCLVPKYPSRNRVKIALSSQVAIVLSSERQAKIDIYCLNSLRYQ